MDKMPAYQRPDTLDQALSQLARGQARPLAGGTDSYVLTQERDLPFPIIDIARLPELRGFSLDATGLRLGAGMTWTEIARANLPPALAALQQAAIQVGGRQIQNAGTLGGNLCNASPAADGVPPLLVVNAGVELASPRGRRVIDLQDFLTGPRQTARASDEILTAILIPATALAGVSRFEKLGARAYLVISIAMVAVRLHVTDGLIRQAAIAVGACSATAQRLPMVETALLGVHVADAHRRIDAALVRAALSPINDIRATADYRHTAATELLRRAVKAVAE
jgi:CO/xanthine dehydrogenase FAD-binding subunit